MTDLQKRFIFEKADIRGEIVQLEQTYEAATENRNFPKPVERLLGQFLAAASLMSSTLKFDGSLSLQAKGSGPLNLIMAESSNQKSLRSVARLDEDVDFDNIDTSDIRKLIGSDGYLAIIIEPDQGERYQGIVPLDSDNLAGCLEHYFQQSEQINTKFWFAESNNRCAGMLLQALPKQVIANAEDNEEYWQTVNYLAETVKSEELLDLEQDAIIYRLFNEFEVRAFESQPVKFQCSCSRQRSENALLSLGETEVNQMLEEMDTIIIDCQFCLQQYNFNSNDIRKLFSKQKPTLH